MFPIEIVLAETTPETEWVRGRALQKVSPTYWHGLAQRHVAAALGAWAQGNGTGRVASEWRFRLTPPGEVTRPLVPDVAFVSYERLARDADRDEIGMPVVAPTLAVEIRSPNDRDDDIRDKVRAYLLSGTVVVLIVDPLQKSAFVFDAEGERSIAAAGSFVHPALPGLVLDLAGLDRE